MTTSINYSDNDIRMRVGQLTLVYQGSPAIFQSKWYFGTRIHCRCRFGNPKNQSLLIIDHRQYSQILSSASLRPENKSLIVSQSPTLQICPVGRTQIPHRHLSPLIEPQCQMKAGDELVIEHYCGPAGSPHCNFDPLFLQVLRSIPCISITFTTGIQPARSRESIDLHD